MEFTKFQNAVMTAETAKMILQVAKVAIVMTQKYRILIMG